MAALTLVGGGRTSEVDSARFAPHLLFGRDRLAVSVLAAASLGELRLECRHLVTTAEFPQMKKRATTDVPVERRCCYRFLTRLAFCPSEPSD